MGGAGRRRMGAVRRARPARRRARRVPRRGAARPRRRRAAIDAGADRRPDRIAGAARRRACRPRRPSAGSSAAWRPSRASSLRASSRPRPTSRSRPISAPGSTAAASSTAAERADTFREEKVVSAQRWAMAPRGQHHRTRHRREQSVPAARRRWGWPGRCSARGCCRSARVYDPFIKRGLDALNYGLYQDARFILVATPSGLTLAPEGGAHQSVIEPLIGIGQPGLIAFEPAFADELAVLLRWALDEIQREDGRSVYFRLSTRPIDQPERPLDTALTEGIVAGAYWLREPAPDAESRDRLLRRRRAGRIGGARGDPRRRAGRRAAGDHLARIGCTATGRTSLAHRKAGHRRSVCWRGCVRARRSLPSPMVTRRRCPGSARWRGNADRSARRRPVRPVRRHPGPLPRIRDRRGRHHRRRGARLSAGRPSDLNAVIAPLGRIDPPPFIAARRASRRGAPAISASARCRSACRHRP